MRYAAIREFVAEGGKSEAFVECYFIALCRQIKPVLTGRSVLVHRIGQHRACDTMSAPCLADGDAADLHMLVRMDDPERPADLTACNRDDMMRSKIKRIEFFIGGYILFGYKDRAPELERLIAKGTENRNR